MKITKRQLRRIIREEKAKHQESPKRAKLRRLIREEAEGGGAPNVDDIARKVSSLGAEGAIQWLGDLMAKLDVGGAAPEPAVAPPPPVEETLPEDM